MVQMCTTSIHLYYGSQWGGRLDRSRLDPNGDGIADHNGEYIERNRNQTDAMIQDASYIASEKS